jgi:hypothetical protein
MAAIETRHRFMWLVKTRATISYVADGTCVVTLSDPNRKMFRGKDLIAAVNAGIAAIPLVARTSSGSTSNTRAVTRATAATAMSKTKAGSRTGTKSKTAKKTRQLA